MSFRDFYGKYRVKLNCVWIILMALVICLTFFSEKRLVYINFTPSIPIGIYINAGFDGTVKEGDTVVYHPLYETAKFGYDRGYWPSTDICLVKHVGACAGQKIFVDENNAQFFCNDKYIGQSSYTDSDGRPIPRIVGLHTVPQGEFLPVGENPMSFDGRYTGTVPVKNIVTKVFPLITWY